jgi:hypothetical protein
MKEETNAFAEESKEICKILMHIYVKIRLGLISGMQNGKLVCP